MSMRATPARKFCAHIAETKRRKTQQRRIGWLEQYTAKIQLVTTIIARMAAAAIASGLLLAQAPRTNVPTRVPPKRSSQIQNGFGINSDLPREPYLPWDRWWWTRMFDAGVSWIRIGQYENTSEFTSWDWIEQKRGVLAIPPGLDDYVDSLIDNGV